MADIGVCNPSGCYGHCPTSTICSRKPDCPPVSPCPPGGYIQREGCGCGCRCPAPEKCPRAHKDKDYLNVIAEDFYYFKHFYLMVRTTPRMPNKPSQMPKGQKMPGKRRSGKDTEKTGDESEKSDKTGGLFDGDDSNDGIEDGDGGKRRKGPPPSKEARLRNKLNTLFDEALRHGLLDNSKMSKKERKKCTPEYYKNVLGIDISCLKDCVPLCCTDGQ